MTTVSDAAGVPPAGDSEPGPDQDAPARHAPDAPAQDASAQDASAQDASARRAPGAVAAHAPGPRARDRLRARAAAGARTTGRVSWALVKGTAAGAFRYRVTGLAAEAAFFALLSLPPLVIGLIGTMGHLRGAIGPDAVADIRTWVIGHAQQVLTAEAVNTTVVPLLNDVINGGRVDIVSVSFLISLWAGSRATNVYVDTITIAYGLSGIRGVIRTRLRAFFLYLVGLLVLVVVIPLLVAGPALVRQALPESAQAVQLLYWPVVISLSIVFLATLYHVSVPVRTAWWRAVPGAALALLIWIFGSITLRIYLTGSFSGVSVYGSLAAAIAVLAWLYVAALAVLIGATLNAEIDRLWPSEVTATARAELAERHAAAADAEAAAEADAEAGAEPGAEPGAGADAGGAAESGAEAAAEGKKRTR
ncbi:YihY/virulence factor BrkB family protein [Actinomadura chibensis]|uniref:YihY/virulence factor BrkB family protein n=1 Tax=Actinomadura chibensis TaxID=392828 RepID=UPI001FEAAA39|nr:YihY/virulence factor BrkB family protein [Actinomadura chibensis]